MKLILVALFLVNLSLGASGGAGHPKSASLDTNSLNLSNAYSGANGTFFSTLAGVSDFALFNGSSLGSVAIAFPTGTDTCATAGYTTKEFVIPASSGYEPLKPVTINKYACVRALSGTVTSGTVTLTIW